jgi:hypothetical protein
MHGPQNAGVRHVDQRPSRPGRLGERHMSISYGLNRLHHVQNVHDWSSFVLVQLPHGSNPAIQLNKRP